MNDNESGVGIKLQPNTDFPSGCDLNFLIAFREGVIKLGQSMGLVISGSSISAGGANITFSLGSEVFQIKMGILKEPTPSETMRRRC